jgi:hypothetical protein
MAVRLLCRLVVSIFSLLTACEWRAASSFGVCDASFAERLLLSMMLH